MKIFFLAVRLSSASRAELSLLDKPEKLLHTHILTCMHINAKLLHTHTHMYAYKCRVFVHGSHSQDG